VITIGVSGFAKSGKDTVADAASEMMEEMGYTCLKVPFAYKLKRITMDKYQIGKTGSGEKSPIERAKFQKVGADGRIFYKEVWIDLSKARILELLNDKNIPLDDKLVVFHSDVRHLNECEFILTTKDAFLLCVDSDLRQGDALNDDMYKHESEIYIPEIRGIAKVHCSGVVIANNGPLKNTLSNLRSILYSRYAEKNNTKILNMCKGILWKNKTL